MARAKNGACETIRNEFAGELFGVSGRFHNVIADRTDGRIRNQEWVSERRKLNTAGDRIQVKIRFDDNCNNGHETFSITADIYDFAGRDVGGGCCHDDICKAFPELAGLIKWHLVSTDGPMHYVANTTYLAGDADHRGKRAGEAYAFDTVMMVDTDPIGHTVKDSFAKFIEEALASDSEFVIEKIEHKRDSGNYEFAPKYTFAGYGDKWHECPFDTYAEAVSWLTAITDCNVRFVQVPTLFSEGKARELDAARKAACWPEATDEQLSAPRAKLEKVLRKRLPALLAEFKATIVAAGFLWPAAR